VLHLITGEHYAGAERVQDLLAARLPELGFGAAFACVKPDRFPELREAKEAPLFCAPMRSKLDLRPAWTVARLLCREGFHILHAHTVRTAMVGRLASLLAGVPMVYHVHSPTSRNTTGRLSDRLNAAVERASLAGGVLMIAVSKSLAEHMIQSGFDPERITVVHNGVPAAASLPDRAPPTHSWTLGTVALFRPRKGVEVLLEAMARLRRRGRDVRLRAVGAFETPGYEAEIRGLAGRLELDPWIEWTGFARHVGGELSCMDLFVLPSLFGEGLPMVVLEAMAAGVPVVATRVEGVPEAVRDGREGVLAAPGDAAALAEAIERVMAGEADWSSLRRAAAARQAAEFSDHSMAEGVAAVYRRILRAQEGPPLTARPTFGWMA
jgi:glycosyltransferase involved in cell wall biosynthesis